MPRLSPNFSRAVFFLYRRDPHSGDVVGPEGSGVIIGEYDMQLPIVHFYAVTAGHVPRTGASIIRLNTHDGKSRDIDLDGSEWEADLTAEDIAIADITSEISHDTDEVSYLPLGMIATESFISEVDLGIGDDGFMLGLFGAHHGNQKRNLIAARFGNISLLANAAHPIERYEPSLKITFKSPCHVFDIHSRPGFSGSPVFVYRTPENDLSDIVYGNGRHVTLRRNSMSMRERETRGPQAENVEIFHHRPDNQFVKLLGIHVAEFNDIVRISKAGEIVSQTNGTQKTLEDGDKIKFPGSMTIVVPAWQIIKLLNGEKLTKKRSEREDAAREDARRGPQRASDTQQSIRDESPRPRHQEDSTDWPTASARESRRRELGRRQTDQIVR